MGEKSGKDGVDKDETPTDGSAPASPPGEILVTTRDYGGEVGGTEFMGRKWETQISLGEGGNRAAKGGNHVKGGGLRDVDGDKGALVEVNVEPGSIGERVKDGF